MAKGKKVLAFCLGLNQAAKDVILGRSMNLIIFEIPLCKVGSLGRANEPAGE